MAAISMQQPVLAEHDHAGEIAGARLGFGSVQYFD
jgi:hypothetical protein